MNILKLSIKNIKSRPLSSLLSLILLTLGVGIVALLIQLNRHVQDQLNNNVRGIDMVLGAKGSPLQLILSSVYHIDSPTGNINLNEAEKIKNNRLVEYGIPLSYGDNFKGYRIVGTTHQYPKLYEASLKQGRLWQHDLEVTIGAAVAEENNLKIGDSFNGVHGLDGGEAHENHLYKVVGIFNYTSSILDQVILTDLKSVWEIHEHEHAEGTDHDADEAHDKEITAMLIKFRSPLGMVQLPRMINENTNMQAAIPAYEINRIFNLMGIGIETLNTLALAIIIVSGLSVFISLFNTLKERRYEMALMRVYGAYRIKLVLMMLQEGLLLTLVGFLLGILGSKLSLWAISHMLEANYHYSFAGWTWQIEDYWLLFTAFSIGLLASLLPAILVFRLNISKTLNHA